MKTFPGKALRIALTLCIGLWALTASGQYTMPQILDTATLKAQADYLTNKTRIYNDYRAIREDMYQKYTGNALDSLTQSKEQIQDLNNRVGSVLQQMDSLSVLLQHTRSEMDEAVRNRDNFSLFGIRMHKVLYNTIVWLVMAGLTVLLVFVYLLFKGSRAGSIRTKKDLEDLREEHENYRKQSRERYEKLVVSHHHEIKKLKEGKG